MDPRPAFDRLRPASADYAELPVPLAFTWDEAATAGTSGEWYMVVFRSVRAVDADEALLTELDDRAHAEAAAAPGFVHYFKGPVGAHGECLSFCLWESRRLARAAAGRPEHVRAVAITGRTYERYELEFHRVVKRADARTFEIAPYDGPLPAREGDGGGADAIPASPGAARIQSTPPGLASA